MKAIYITGKIEVGLAGDPPPGAPPGGGGSRGPWGPPRGAGGPGSPGFAATVRSECPWPLGAAKACHR